MTAFDRYALRAFEVHAIDYLLKPIDGARLQLAVAAPSPRALARSEDEHTNTRTHEPGCSPC